jgi:hypothetical protein
MFGVSTKGASAAAPSAKVHPVHADSSLGTISNLSHGNSNVSAQAAPSGKNGPGLVGAVSDMVSPFVSPRDGLREPGKREAKRRGSKDGLEFVPGGNLVNPSLTTGAVGKIEQFSAIEAWHKQPTGTGASAVSSRDYATVEPFEAHGKHCSNCHVVLPCYSVDTLVEG